MKITKKSKLTGIVHIMELNVTEEQLVRFNNGEFVQHVFPNLNSYEREFILTGITKEEWEKEFPKEDEDPDGIDDDYIESVSAMDYNAWRSPADEHDDSITNSDPE